MLRHRPLFLLLALLLSLTSVTMAQARMQMMGASTVEICADGMAMTVTVDATGTPIYHAHHCPDCTPAMAALPVFAAVGVVRPVGRVAPVLPDGQAQVAQAAAVFPSARDPPLGLA